MTSSDPDGSAGPTISKTSSPPFSPSPPMAHLRSASLSAATSDHDDSELSRLQALGADIREQDEIERDVNRQAEEHLALQDFERDQKRLDKAEAEKEKLKAQIDKINAELHKPFPPPPAKRQRLINQLEHYDALVDNINEDIKDIVSRLRQRADDVDGFGQNQSNDGQLPGESRRDFLVRTGKITPFSKVAQRREPGANADLRDLLLDAEQSRTDDGQDDHIDWDGGQRDGEGLSKDDGRSHRHLMRPGFESRSRTQSETTEASLPFKRKRRTDSMASDFQPEATPEEDNDDLVVDTSDEDDGLFQPELATKKRKRGAVAAPRKSAKKSVTHLSEEYDFSDEPVDVKDDLSSLDDGDETNYQKRLTKWIKGRSAARNKHRAQLVEPTELHDEEWFLPHPSIADMEMENRFKLPGDIHPALFDYQKTGVLWLSELYNQEVGGIVGDEMGLGKTIQVIAFLAGLHYSKLIDKPTLIVCPATVMRQWVNEFHAWWPAFRVSILHSSGSGMIDMKREDRAEADMERTAVPGRAKAPLTKVERAAKKIVDRAVKDGHILVTTYAGLMNYADLLIPVEWQCAILDEGHKIRNPDAAITIHCKELRTTNRIILSGTPIQNNLIELWSLFDFVFPMRLGNLLNFRHDFEIPIKQGGYANASNLQVMTATKCAQTLRDAIQPYLLQRLKADVATDLPQKRERVLMCQLTEVQRLTYKHFLNSGDVKAIMEGNRNPLFGIDMLRKICNHPDLADHKALSKMTDYDYGNPRVSGKMKVVKLLLDMWVKGGHKTLLFSQSKLTLNILEKQVQNTPRINYRRMDGETAIKDRQRLVDEFNSDSDLHVFLLTTKVGGLGINLTGADRVIIFDPDWNPSTDIQARERAWRLGQKREVQIFRLLLQGTIEEKIFHRQIFKQHISAKVLKDPSKRNTLNMKDMHDLFTLDESTDGTETGKIFRGTETRVEAPNLDRAHDLTSTGETSGLIDSASKETASAEQEEETRLRSLQGISSVQETDGKTAEDRENEFRSEEARLLNGIFARSGVSSTVEHDRIINGRIEYAADARIIQRHANKAAAAAAKALDEAEKIARQTPAGVPTWTGISGSAGRPRDAASPLPSSRSRASTSSPAPSVRSNEGPLKVNIGNSSSGGARSIGGARSAGVVSQLRRQQQIMGSNARSVDANASTSNHSNGPSSNTSTSLSDSNRRGRSSNEDPTLQEIGRDIKDYLRANGGSAVTQMIIDHFSHRMKQRRGLARSFETMLKQVATLEESSRSGRGRWTLKKP